MKIGAFFLLIGANILGQYRCASLGESSYKIRNYYPYMRAVQQEALYSNPRNQIAEVSVHDNDNLSPLDRADLAYIRDFNRYKRSGSGDILHSIKSSIGQGIKSKLGMLAQGSSAVISHFSGNGPSSHYFPIDEHHHGGKAFDLWSLKKSIFHTLLQAAKAIKGVVIAGKGHIIKGGGRLISGGGRLISAKGEALTTLGKHIASSAILSPHKHHSAAIEYSPPHGHIEYGPSHGHEIEYISSPSAPEASYGPSPIKYHHGPSSYVPQKYYSPDEAKHYKPAHHGPHGGIVILKKIPSEHIHHHHEHLPHHYEHEHVEDSAHDYNKHEESHNSHVSEFKPIAPSVITSVLPKVKHIVSSIFSASSVPSDAHSYHDHNDHSDHSSDFHNSEPHSTYSEQDYNEHGSSNQNSDYYSNNISPINNKYIGSASNDNEGVALSPLATSYGTPEGPPIKYMEYNQKDKTMVLHHKPERDNVINSQINFVTPVANGHNVPYPSPTISSHPEQFKIEVLDPTQSTQLLTTSLSNDHYTNPTQLYIGMHLPLHGDNTPVTNTFQQYPVDSNIQYMKYFPQQTDHLPQQNNLFLYTNDMTDQRQYLDENSSNIKNNVVPFASQSSHSSTANNYVESNNKGSKKTTRNNLRLKMPPTIDIVRSVAFELGPNGPVKI